MQEKPDRPKRGRTPLSEPPKRELLIAAAIKSFAQFGYVGTSLRKVAAEAGADVALVTHSFGSKMGLWKAVIDRQAEDINSRLSVIAADEVTEEGEQFAYIYEQLAKPIDTMVVPLITRARAEKGLAPVDADSVFVALTGIMAFSVASRPSLQRIDDRAVPESMFRERLFGYVISLVFAP